MLRRAGYLKIPDLRMLAEGIPTHSGTNRAGQPYANRGGLTLHSVSTLARLLP